METSALKSDPSKNCMKTTEAVFFYLSYAWPVLILAHYVYTHFVYTRKTYEKMTKEQIAAKRKKLKDYHDKAILSSASRRSIRKSARKVARVASRCNTTEKELNILHKESHKNCTSSVVSATGSMTSASDNWSQFSETLVNTDVTRSTELISRDSRSHKKRSTESLSTKSSSKKKLSKDSMEPLLKKSSNEKNPEESLSNKHILEKSSEERLSTKSSSKEKPKKASKEKLPKDSKELLREKFPKLAAKGNNPEECLLNEHISEKTAKESSSSKSFSKENRSKESLSMEKPSKENPSSKKEKETDVEAP
ncbi:hypothetical protein L596_012905 [Steinernema carpocapsae]|uniref:Uncharacterized protein n=1 Tax=Steinernema carpocapsae TaxID=34508 RepID=A0A4U5NYT2_STECR|nr:hypothetical protein L596_012905 [Steinernema carpocapsae]